MLYELRIYRARPGQRAAWVKFFEEEIVPYLHAKGIVVVGSFVGEQDEDQHVWMRRFDSEDERIRLYEALYESEHWQTNLSPRVGELILIVSRPRSSGCSRRPSPCCTEARDARRRRMHLEPVALTTYRLVCIIEDNGPGQEPEGA